MNEIEALVRMALEHAGVPASDEEIAAVVAAYASFKAGVESLYAVADARHESPALSFQPDVPLP
jgi:hypothetical protein